MVELNLDQKTRAHIEDAMHRREPTITGLAKKYNGMLKQMVQLRVTDAVAANAILPPAIILKTLFKLDVDDDTWHDIGLEDVEEFGGVLPPWLGDDTVRAGIRFDQEVANCEGELARCHMERAAMQNWFEEEYEATSLAEQYTPGGRCYVSSFGGHDANIRDILDLDLKYHLQLRLRSLTKLGETWRRKMPGLMSQSPWPELIAPVPSVQTRARPAIATGSARDGDFDAQSSDDDCEMELEPAAIYDVHVMEEIDNRAREQEWEPEGSAE
jgi:hypothetical protein